MKLQKKYEIGQKIATREAYGDALAEFGVRSEQALAGNRSENSRALYPTLLRTSRSELVMERQTLCCA